jgi:hypothetical protein
VADRNPPAAPTKRGPRWGVRTMLFLVLAFVAIYTAKAMNGHTVGTMGSLVLGLGGAAYCSVRGVRDARARGLHGLLYQRRRQG